MDFQTLDATRIIETIARLRERIRERFPQANLGAVAAALLDLARSHAQRSARIRRPSTLLRLISIALCSCAVLTIAALVASVRLRVADEWQISEAVQTLEAGISMLFFLGAGAVFALSLDLRRRRRLCLEALHELRAMAHIVDMHQLTKDPDRLHHPGQDTPSSPRRTLSPFELSRYLDYCSEMLSLMGKLAALYAQGFPDGEAVAAVDEVEDLTTNLSRKIWQKIMVLESRTTTPHP